MDYPKITVVTPSFNQAGFLEETMQSVLGQNYPNLEYIVVDGGSTDGSIGIIRKYEKQLAWWVSEKDNGLYHALSKGFARSTGDVMCWINSDDKLHLQSLFVVAEIFSAFREVEWLQGLPSVIDENGRVVYVKNFRKWSKFHFYLNDPEHIQQESCFWRRSLWEKAGGKLDDALNVAGDYELWLRFFDHAELYCSRALLGAFRVRSGNQLSLEKMELYKEEVAGVLGRKLAALAPEVQQQLDSYRKPPAPGWLDRILDKFGKKMLQPPRPSCPPEILFDRHTQRFILENRS